MTEERFLYMQFSAGANAGAGAGLYLNSRINAFSELKYFDFHTHVLFK